MRAQEEGEGEDGVHSGGGRCSFLSIEPREGDILLFPSWLLHGVTRLQVRREDRDSFAGKRVTLAFNVEEQI